MHLMTRLTEQKGLTAPGTADRLDALLRQLDMPLQLPDFDEETLISAMFMDKKFSGQVLRVIVLNQIGKCFIHPTDATFFRGMTNI
jgi:3-dehydroquinate synthase